MSRDDYSVERLSPLQLQGIHLLRLQLVSIRLAFQQGSINENIFYDKVNRCVVTLSETWHLALATNEEPPVSHRVKLIVLLKEQIPLTDGEFNHVLNNVVPSAPVLPVPASLPFGNYLSPSMPIAPGFGYTGLGLGMQYWNYDVRGGPNFRNNVMMGAHMPGYGTGAEGYGVPPVHPNTSSINSFLNFGDRIGLER
jgi:hypothetical protein